MVGGDAGVLERGGVVLMIGLANFAKNAMFLLHGNAANRKSMNKVEPVSSSQQGPARE